MKMLKTTLLLSLAGTIAFSLAPRTTAAQPSEEDLITKYGIGVTVGGGVEGFTEKGRRDTTKPVGTWDVRAQLGTRLPVSIEAAYLGSAATIDSLLGSQSGTLIGTAVEGDARLNLLTEGAWQPYGFVGAAWRRYDVTQATFTTADSGMNDSDNLFEVPMGAGLTYKADHFLFDVRGTFRYATNQDLVQVNSASQDFVPMHTWAGSARIGYEF
jgi:hypothetical protein